MSDTVRCSHYVYTKWHHAFRTTNMPFASATNQCSIVPFGLAKELTFAVHLAAASTVHDAIVPWQEPNDGKTVDVAEP